MELHSRPQMEGLSPDKIDAGAEAASAPAPSAAPVKQAATGPTRKEKEALVAAELLKGTKSLKKALEVWATKLGHRDFIYLPRMMDEAVLQAWIQKARDVKDVQHYRFALSVTRSIHNLKLFGWWREEREILTGTLAKLTPGTVRKGVVTEVREFGAFLEMDGALGLLHISEIEWEFVAHPKDHLQVGQEIEVVIMEVDWEKQRANVSRKQMLFADWDRKAGKYLFGTRVSGTVASVAEEGVTIEIEPGLRATIAPTELQWGHGASPTLKYTVGQQVEAVVQSVTYAKQMITASVRRAHPNQWDDGYHRYPIGAVVTGTVVKVQQPGAFVDLEPGVQGLVPLKELTWDEKSRPADVLTVGQTVTVKVIDVDPVKKRIQLSMKQVIPDPWLTVPERYPVGTKVRGKAINVQQYGVFIDLETGVQGLLHVSELSWHRQPPNPNKLVKEGDEIETVVMDVKPAERKISLSLRQLQPNPWEIAKTQMPVGSRVKVKVVRKKGEGYTVQTDNGLFGAIPAAEATWEGTYGYEPLQPDAEIEVIVTEVDVANARLFFSLKQLSNDPWNEVPAIVKPGDVVTGVVQKVLTNAVFLALGEHHPGLTYINGLLARSFLDVGPDDDLKALFPIGQKVTATVALVDPGERRIALRSPRLLEK